MFLSNINKNILTKSPYFRAIFEGNFRESTESTITINYQIDLFEHYINYLKATFHGSMNYVENINMVNIFDYFSDDASIESYIEICQDKVKEIILQKKYEKLVDISYIDLKRIDRLDLIEIFKLDAEFLMKIIENIIDLECETIDKWRPIHYICRYIIDKGVDLECEDDKKWQPIHYICFYSTSEMMKYIIDKGDDLECEDDKKWRPIHLICGYSTLGMIKYIIDKGVELECTTELGATPKYLIDGNTSLTRIQKNELIKYLKKLISQTSK